MILPTVVSAALIFEQYEDATYKYLGEALPGTALSVPLWRVARVNKSTNQVRWASNGDFSSVFTDLATVAALTFA